MDGEERVTRLHEAVVNGNRMTVIELLDEGVDVNQEVNFRSPLGWATECGRTEIAEVLLDRGCDVNFGDRRMKSPLYIASRTGDLDLVKLLLKYMPNLQLQHVNGNTALHQAVIGGHAHIVTELLAVGCNVNAVNNGKETAVHMACLRGHTEITEMLLGAGGDVRATKGKHVVEPIHMAAHGGHVDILQLLIQAGVSIDTTIKRNGRTALHIAAINNNVRFVDELLMRKCLIDPISLENEEAKTPLIKAVELGNLEVAEKLISAGADIDMGDHWGVTSLITVMLNGNIYMAHLLIRAGCDTNLPCKNRLTPFSASLHRHGNAKLTRSLVLANCVLTDDDRILFDKTVLTNQTEEWKTLFDEVKDMIINARSLQHLCRSAIRVYLGKVPGVKIEQLCLPTKVKDYLMYSDL